MKRNRERLKKKWLEDNWEWNKEENKNCLTINIIDIYVLGHVTLEIVNFDFSKITLLLLIQYSIENRILYNTIIYLFYNLCYFTIFI